MKIDRSRVKKILVITLSNIGDAVLTVPVIQSLRRQFPHQHLAVLASPRSFAVFKTDQRIDKCIVYEKKMSWRNRFALINRLRQEKYDLVIDLRNTAFGLLIGPRYRTSLILRPPKAMEHMRERHLWKLKSLGLDGDKIDRPLLSFSEDERIRIDDILKKTDSRKGGPLVAIAPGARNLTKPWQKEGYRDLIKGLIAEFAAKIILVGDDRDKELSRQIVQEIKPLPEDLCGETSIGELAYLLSKCELLISNDSAPMHVGWAMGVPVIAIFGPTNHKKYGPFDKESRIIRKDLSCSPCEQSMCPLKTRDCMTKISAQEVLDVCKEILKKR